MQIKNPGGWEPTGIQDTKQTKLKTKCTSKVLNFYVIQQIK